jgi:hypothetical protein
MASGVVAVGLFGTTWVAGVVGSIGASLGNEAVTRVGTVSRMLLRTYGLLRGAMKAFQDPSALALFGEDGGEAFPFLSAAPGAGRGAREAARRGHDEARPSGPTTGPRVYA